MNERATRVKAPKASKSSKASKACRETYYYDGVTAGDDGFVSPKLCSFNLTISTPCENDHVSGTTELGTDYGYGSGRPWTMWNADAPHKSLTTAATPFGFSRTAFGLNETQSETHNGGVVISMWDIDTGGGILPDGPGVYYFTGHVIWEYIYPDPAVDDDYIIDVVDAGGTFIDACAVLK